MCSSDLASASGSPASLDLICPYRLALPAAPWVAAEKEHRQLETAVLDRALEQLRAAHDFVVVETAGGLLVPLARGLDFAVLAKRWNLPVLVVAGSRLGVLNQCLLTVRHLESAHLSIAGVILNHPFGDRGRSSLGVIHDAALETNATVLRRMIDGPLWEIPFSESETSVTLDARFDQIADELIGTLRAKH